MGQRLIYAIPDCITEKLNASTVWRNVNFHLKPELIAEAGPDAHRRPGPAGGAAADPPAHHALQQQLELPAGLIAPGYGYGVAHTRFQIRKNAITATQPVTKAIR